MGSLSNNKGGSQLMGTKGSKLSPAATDNANAFVERLMPLGDVTSKKMFGGYGIFEGGKMFALVDSDGEIFLKAGEVNKGKFESAGSTKHGRMPYYRIPKTVLEDDALLFEWARESIQLSKS
jgi:DNA transformation protein